MYFYKTWLRINFSLIVYYLISLLWNLVQLSSLVRHIFIFLIYYEQIDYSCLINSSVFQYCFPCLVHLGIEKSLLNLIPSNHRGSMLSGKNWKVISSSTFQIYLLLKKIAMCFDLRTWFNSFLWLLVLPSSLLILLSMPSTTNVWSFLQVGNYHVKILLTL